MDYSILITKAEEGYELLDSGSGEKLERYGQFLVSRPDPQALWSKSLGENDWFAAHAQFAREEEKGSWKVAKGIPERWHIEFTVS